MFVPLSKERREGGEEVGELRVSFLPQPNPARALLRIPTTEKIVNLRRMRACGN